MTVMKKKEVGQYGDTHYVVENDYKKKDLPPMNKSIHDSSPF
jgi:hypothetical protein